MGDARDLTGLRVLLVLAHPDDESLACGGTAAMLAARGAEVVLVCATREEAGPGMDAGALGELDFADLRTGELDEAARTLGLARVVRLGHPDGMLRWAEPDRLQREIRAATEAQLPDAVITFDVDGLYWHDDHVVLHERTTAALAELGADAPALYYVTLPGGAMTGVREAARARGAPMDALTFWGIEAEAFGAAAPEPTLALDVTAWADRKLAALRCHRSQVGPSSPFAWIDEADARHWLGRETFRRAAVGAALPGPLERLAHPDGGIS